MHIHQYRLHPDWIARVEMFRKFASQAPEVDEAAPEGDKTPDLPPARRWPLPKLSYRHRSTFPRQPR